MESINDSFIDWGWDGGSTEGWGLIKLLLTDIIVHGQVFIFFIAVL